MNDGDFRLVKDGHLAILTLDRPEKRNALTGQTLLQLRKLAESLSVESEVRAVVLRAEGKDFSVGVDVSTMGQRPPPTVAMRRSAEFGAQLVRAIREIHQPTICAIQGIATGGATCIATACDFRIATDSTKMGYGEVKLGINLMWNALPLAIELVGNARAKQMVMSGALFDAATLHHWGFVDELVPRDTLDEAARAMAERYASLPPIAVQMIKRSANACAGALSQAIMHADGDQWLLASKTDDFKEGVASFFEKRTPTFTGD
jgi:enoyl-CoA hydratase/carnithine racemase